MKLKTGYEDYSTDDLLHLGEKVPPNITGRPIFATLKPTPAQVDDATEALRDAMDMVGPARAQALKAATHALATLLGAIAVNAPQIPSVTDTDLAAIGLPIMKERVRETNVPPAPADLRLRHGAMPGEVRGVCQPAGPNIRGYVSQYTLDPNGSTWTDGARSASSRGFNWSGLERGKDVWFRVAAINTVGQGPWSDPATIMVT